jgi:hypothetical protein
MHESHRFNVHCVFRRTARRVALKVILQQQQQQQQQQ